MNKILINLFKSIENTNSLVIRNSNIFKKMKQLNKPLNKEEKIEIILSPEKHNIQELIQNQRFIKLNYLFGKIDKLKEQKISNEKKFMKKQKIKMK